MATTTTAPGRFHLRHGGLPNGGSAAGSPDAKRMVCCLAIGIRPQWCVLLRDEAERSMAAARHTDD